MREISLTEDQLAIVKQALNRYLPSTIKVWVFGSRAKNTAKTFSDLDIALQAPKGQPLPLEVMIDLAEAFDQSDLPIKIDLVDLNNITDEFKALIISDCLLIQDVG